MHRAKHRAADRASAEVLATTLIERLAFDSGSRSATGAAVGALVVGTEALDGRADAVGFRVDSSLVVAPGLVMSGGDS